MFCFVFFILWLRAARLDFLFVLAVVGLGEFRTINDASLCVVAGLEHSRPSGMSHVPRRRARVCVLMYLIKNSLPCRVVDLVAARPGCCFAGFVFLRLCGERLEVGA